MSSDDRLLDGQGRRADVVARGTSEILKLYQAGHPRERIEQEAANACAAFAAGVRTPRVVDVITVGDRTGIVFERADGLPLLDAMSARPAEAVALASAFAALHADMHAREAVGLPSQRAALDADIGRAVDVPVVMRDAARATLASLPDGQVFCHGDFHPLNVIVTAAGLTVLDWYKATRGNADADVARTLMLLRLTPLPRATREDVRRAVAQVRAAFFAAYCRRYAELRVFALAEPVRWMVPIAVARLAGDVSAGERRQLLGLVKGLLDGRGKTIFG